MRKLLKGISSVLILGIVMSLLAAGCGTVENDVAASAEEENTGIAAGSDTGVKAAAETGTAAGVAGGERKKIIVVQENDNSYVLEQQENAVKALAAGGYTNENSDITVINMGGDEKKSPETLDKIKEVKPDVVLLAGERFSFAAVAQALDGTGIPVVVNQNAETKEYGFLDENGMPRGNVTGVLTMPKDMLPNAYTFLNQVSPINGKKAVFITAPGMFTKEQVESALKSINVELKAYEDCKYLEDYEAKILQYNADDEVGWTLIGLTPLLLSGDVQGELNVVTKWHQENLVKPCVTFWDVAVGAIGIPCGLAVDTATNGTRIGEIGVMILKGENIRNIKAEDPKKINIVLNLQAAKHTGIEFPAEIIGSAKVYTDYNGGVVK